MLSPFLWTTLEGKVWSDGTVSSCLRKACSRACIPQLHTLTWRHFAAAICKEKFSARDKANFSSDGIPAEDIEDELDLAVLALQSNYSYATFNLAYTSSNKLTMDTLLHWNHRVSKLWQDLFRFEMIFQGKRERSASSDALSIRTLEDIKRSQQRKRATYSEADLLNAARQINHQADLQFRVPGQRAGILAVLGSYRAE